MGDGLQNLHLATKSIGAQVGKICKQSSVYKTAAWGNTAQSDFYNQVIEIESALPAQELLQQLLAIEKTMGRERKHKWEPRIIDLDILYYGDSVIVTEHLQVPHPYLHERRFTLVPLVEIAPAFVHPLLQKTNTQLLQICPDKLNVEKL